ncbi:hypothetical protein MKW92_025184 [Papaver armeniacum]|nr:hypothetical protein MKW92_025184 [Papaver armeniacum]
MLQPFFIEHEVQLLSHCIGLWGTRDKCRYKRSENTSKRIFKDDVVMSLFPVSIDEDEVKSIHTQDEAREKIEGAGDGMTTAEHNVQEDVIATDLPAISLLEKIIRNGCQEDEACNKEPETQWGNEDEINEYVEANGAITDISAIAIGEGTSYQRLARKRKTRPNQKGRIRSVT